MTTVNIKELQSEGLLHEQSAYTNTQILNAAIILSFKNGLKTDKEIYDDVSSECDMSLQITLNEMWEEREGYNTSFVQYAETHS